MYITCVVICCHGCEAETSVTCTLAGPTWSGKTQFVFRLIKHADQLIDSAPERIVYCYAEFQPSFLEFPYVEFHQGLPDVSHFDGRQRVLLILDDLINNADKNVCNLFTALSHHRNVSVFSSVRITFIGILISAP